MFRPISDASIRSQTPPSEYNAAPLDFGRFHPISDCSIWFTLVGLIQFYELHTHNIVLNYVYSQWDGKDYYLGFKKKHFFLCVRIERSQNSVNIYDFQSCRDAWPRLGFSITITPTLLLKENQNWLKKYRSSPQMKLFVAVLSAL